MSRNPQVGSLLEMSRSDPTNNSLRAVDWVRGENYQE